MRLENKVDDLENRSGRNKVLVFGLPEDEKSPESLANKITNEIFKEKLGVTISSIERLHRLRQKRGSRPRPVILKLYNHREKELLLQNARKLKGTSISIGEDFSRRVQTIRKALLESAKDNKQNGD